MRVPALAFSLLLLSAAPGQDAPVTLKFSYAPGDKETVQADLTLKMAIQLKSEAINMEQKTRGPVRFTIAKICREAKPKEFLFDAVFGGLEMEQDVEAAGQKVKMTVKGKHVRAETGDGQVVIDTEKGINPEQAAPLLEEFKLFNETMDLGMDDRGFMKGLEKNEKLRSFMQGMGGDNLYPVILPDKPVKVGEEWTYVNKLRELGELKLSGEPMEVTLRFRLESVEGEGAARVALISSRVEQEFKDVECRGKLEGVEKEAKIKIRSMKLAGKGETRFLPTRGRLQSSGIDMGIKAEMSMEIEELGGETNLKLDLTVNAKMSPEVKARKDF